MDSCAEWGWPDTLQTIQGGVSSNCGMALQIAALVNPNIVHSINIAATFNASASRVKTYKELREDVNLLTQVSY